jgi:hypothetical protein
MNNPDASDYSPLAFGTGLALGLMLVFGLPRATNAPPSASRGGGPGGVGTQIHRSDASAQSVEMVAVHRAWAQADQNQR